MSETARNEPNLPKVSTTVEKSGTKLMLSAALSIVLFAGAMTIGAMVYKKLSTQTQQSQAQVNELQSQYNDLEQQFNEQQQLIEKQQSKLHAVIASATSTQQNWQLGEAQYLIQLANFSVGFDRNPSVAIQLLQAADERLATLKEPKLIHVRQSIADNITALKSTPTPDTATALLQLNAIGGQIINLPVIATPNAVPESNQPKKHHHHQPGWKRGLQQSWEELKQIIVVQYHDQPVGQLITPQNRNYLDLHLQMLLAEAQWACLHQQGNLYTASLQQAIDWVKNYYVESAASTQAVLTGLQSLAAINIAPKMPDISSSLDAMNTYMSADPTPATPLNGVTP